MLRGEPSALLGLSTAAASRSALPFRRERDMRRLTFDSGVSDGGVDLLERLSRDRSAAGVGGRGLITAEALPHAT